MSRHDVSSGASRYPVFCGRGLLAQLPSLLRDECRLAGADIVAVIPENVVRLVGVERLRTVARDIITFDDGEKAKTFSNAAALVERFSSTRMRRDSIALVVGGGVAGDLAGFAASIFLRGIRVVHLPTTLLAQVDSSIGGKTGVNLGAGKNLAGTFHDPIAVIADVDVLSTLDQHQMLSGLFEALKSGVIADAKLFELIESDQWRQRIEEVVDRSIAVKARIVTEDPKESGARKLLNYGHTIGHAIEAALDYEGLTHGEAVAWGMIAANEVASAQGLLDAGTRSRIDRAIRALNPRTFEAPRDLLERFTTSDKKFSTKAKFMTLPHSIGGCGVHEVSDAQIRRAIDAVFAKN